MVELLMVVVEDTDEADVRDEVRDEVRGEVRDKVRNEVKDEVKVMINESVLIVNRCINLNIDSLIVISKFFLPKLAYIALALHHHGRLRTHTVCVIKSYT